MLADLVSTVSWRFMMAYGDGCAGWWVGDWGGWLARDGSLHEIENERFGGK